MRNCHSQGRRPKRSFGATLVLRNHVDGRCEQWHDRTMVRIQNEIRHDLKARVVLGKFILGCQEYDNFAPRHGGCRAQLTNPVAHGRDVPSGKMMIWR